MAGENPWEMNWGNTQNNQRVPNPEAEAQVNPSAQPEPWDMDWNNNHPQGEEGSWGLYNSEDGSISDAIGKGFSRWGRNLAASLPGANPEESNYAMSKAKNASREYQESMAKLGTAGQLTAGIATYAPVIAAGVANPLVGAAAMGSATTLDSLSAQQENNQDYDWRTAGTAGAASGVIDYATLGLASRGVNLARSLSTPVRRVAAGAAAQGAQGAASNSAAMASINLASGRPWSEGVPEAALIGAVAGAGLHSSMEGLRGFTNAPPSPASSRIRESQTRIETESGLEPNSNYRNDLYDYADHRSYFEEKMRNTDPAEADDAIRSMVSLSMNNGTAKSVHDMSRVFQDNNIPITMLAFNQDVGNGIATKTTGNILTDWFGKSKREIQTAGESSHKANAPLFGRAKANEQGSYGEAYRAKLKDKFEEVQNSFISRATTNLNNVKNYRASMRDSLEPQVRQDLSDYANNLSRYKEMIEDANRGKFPDMDDLSSVSFNLLRLGNKLGMSSEMKSIVNKESFDPVSNLQTVLLTNRAFESDFPTIRNSTPNPYKGRNESVLGVATDLGAVGTGNLWVPIARRAAVEAKNRMHMRALQGEKAKGADIINSLARRPEKRTFEPSDSRVVNNEAAQNGDFSAGAHEAAADLQSMGINTGGAETRVPASDVSPQRNSWGRTPEEEAALLAQRQPEAAPEVNVWGRTPEEESAIQTAAQERTRVNPDAWTGRSVREQASRAEQERAARLEQERLAAEQEAATTPVDPEAVAAARAERQSRLSQDARVDSSRRTPRTEEPEATPEPTAPRENPEKANGDPADMILVMNRDQVITHKARADLLPDDIVIRGTEDAPASTPRPDLVGTSAREAQARRTSEAEARAQEEAATTPVEEVVPAERPDLVGTSAREARNRRESQPVEEPVVTPEVTPEAPQRAPAPDLVGTAARDAQARRAASEAESTPVEEPVVDNSAERAARQEQLARDARVSNQNYKRAITDKEKARYKELYDKQKTEKGLTRGEMDEFDELGQKYMQDDLNRSEAAVASQKAPQATETEQPSTRTEEPVEAPTEAPVAPKQAPKSSTKASELVTRPLQKVIDDAKGKKRTPELVNEVARARRVQSEVTDHVNAIAEKQVRDPEEIWGIIQKNGGIESLGRNGQTISKNLNDMLAKDKVETARRAAADAEKAQSDAAKVIDNSVGKDIEEVMSNLKKHFMSKNVPGELFDEARDIISRRFEGDYSPQHVANMVRELAKERAKAADTTAGKKPVEQAPAPKTMSDSINNLETYAKDIGLNVKEADVKRIIDKYTNPGSKDPKALKALSEGTERSAYNAIKKYADDQIAEYEKRLSAPLTEQTAETAAWRSRVNTLNNAIRDAGERNARYREVMGLDVTPTKPTAKTSFDELTSYSETMFKDADGNSTVPDEVKKIIDRATTTRDRESGGNALTDAGIGRVMNKIKDYLEGERKRLDDVLSAPDVKQSPQYAQWRRDLSMVNDALKREPEATDAMKARISEKAKTASEQIRRIEAEDKKAKTAKQDADNVSKAADEAFEEMKKNVDDRVKEATDSVKKGLDGMDDATLKEAALKVSRDLPDYITSKYDPEYLKFKAFMNAQKEILRERGLGKEYRAIDTMTEAIDNALSNKEFLPNNPEYWLSETDIRKVKVDLNDGVRANSWYADLYQNMRFTIYGSTEMPSARYSQKIINREIKKAQKGSDPGEGGIDAFGIK